MGSSVQSLVIGAGIVECSTAHHLARLGTTDVAAVKQAPLATTGGSTSHAPALLFKRPMSQAGADQRTSQLATDTEVARPLLRHQDSPTHVRQIHDRTGVGCYQHRTTPAQFDEIGHAEAPGSGGEASSAAGGWAGKSTVHGFIPEGGAGSTTSTGCGHNSGTSTACARVPADPVLNAKTIWMRC